MSDKHFDKEDFKREGFFSKDEKLGPHPDYRKSTGDGFKGARWEAHHVIPQTSLKKSIAEQSKSLQSYIEDVQYITKWAINNPDNMIGLPVYTSYVLYYQAQDGLVGADATLSAAGALAARAKRYIGTYNKKKKETRDGWLGSVAKHSPENLPLHQPVSWGHTDYDKRLRMVLTKQVWNSLSEAKDKHDVDAENVKSLLDKISSGYKKHLVKRGQGANRDKWNKRFDMQDRSWFKPFTMDVAVKENPLFK